jgi:MFS family permease
MTQVSFPPFIRLPYNEEHKIPFGNTELSEMNVSADDSNTSNSEQIHNGNQLSILPTKPPLNHAGAMKLPVSYWNLVSAFPRYRYFLISYIVTQLGEWFTYVASLSILELAANQSQQAPTSIMQQHGDDVNVQYMFESSPSSTRASNQHHFLISLLVVCRLIPNTLSSFAGGILADTYDRKMIMLRLDICGGFVAVVFYIMAVNTFYSSKHRDSIGEDDESLSTAISATSVVVLLLCTVAQSTISGLYQPSRTAIVPMLVTEDGDKIEKANEMSSIIWSLSASVGSSLGGFVVNHYGVAVCFATDAIMYLMSAVILAVFVTGNYNVTECVQIPATSTTALKSASKTSATISHNKRCIAQKNIETESKNLDTGKQLKQEHTKSRREGSIKTVGVLTSLREARTFVTTHDSASYLLLKGCGALLFGASDVINVTFSQDEATGDIDAQRLGYLFSAVGIGCLLGPIVMPATRCYMTSCIASYFVIGMGYGCVALSKSFWWKCFWTILRASGTAVLWVDSSILIQTTTPSTMLGRISSIDLALALLAEALSAMFAGTGQDFGMSAQNISLVLSGCGLFWGAIWTIATIWYRRRRDKCLDSSQSSVELEPLYTNLSERSIEADICPESGGQ